MLKAVDDSTRDICESILGHEISFGKYPKGDFYGASIPLAINKKEEYYFIYLKRDTLKLFNEKFLIFENVSESDYCDLCKEIANLIIGKAKVILQEENKKNAYKLGTPEYLGRVKYPFPMKLENKQIYKIANRLMIIATNSKHG